MYFMEILSRVIGKRQTTLLAIVVCVFYSAGNCSLSEKLMHEVPLYQACYQGKIDEVKNLVNEEKMHQKQFDLALHYACDRDDSNLEVVKYLVEMCKVDLASTPILEERSCEEWDWRRYPTPLFYAFQKGNSDIVRYLLPKIRIFSSCTKEECQQAQDFILDVTSLNKMREKIGILLEREDIKELRRLCGQINLKEFVKEYNAKIVRLNGFDSVFNNLSLSRSDFISQEYLSTQSNFFCMKADLLTELNPLEIACKKASLSLLRFLIEEQKLDPWYAACHENYSILYPLLLWHSCDNRSGCKLFDCITYFVDILHLDPTEKSWSGETVLHALCHNSHPYCCNVYKAIDYFVKKGVPINAQDDYGETALYKAVEANNLDLVTLLVEKYNAVIDKSILFKISILPPNLPLIRYLVSHGADPGVTREGWGN